MVSVGAAYQQTKGIIVHLEVLGLRDRIVGLLREGCAEDHAADMGVGVDHVALRSTGGQRHQDRGRRKGMKRGGLWVISQIVV